MTKRIEPASPEVLKAVGRLRAEGENRVTMSTGVVFGVTPVAGMVITDILRSFPEPKVPVTYIESKAREEENPLDPDYRKALEERELKRSLAVNDAFILLGTQVLECPGAFPKVGDETWVAKLAVLGIAAPENEHVRYIAWVKYIAAPLGKDVIALLQGVGRLSAVSEEDVQSAAGTFRREGE